MNLFNNAANDFNKQYPKIAKDIIEKLNQEFLIGFRFGYNEYVGGAWEAKSWKKDLDNFAKLLDDYTAPDLKYVLQDPRRLGLGLGKLHAMLSSKISHILLNEDLAANVLIEIIDKLKKIPSFDIGAIKKRILRIDAHNLTPMHGIPNLKKVLQKL